MKWSLLVGKVWGTEIRLHASLLLLIPYVLVTFQPRGTADTLRVFLLIIAIFACVALHELGHTLAARMYHIPVTSIVLWPLGGVANLGDRPDKTFPNIVIAAAGPLTNLVLTAGLLTLTVFERMVSILPGLEPFARLLRETETFPLLAALTISNASLAVFNLIPVYPLDGGHIARGLLKLLVGERWADNLLMLFSLPLALGVTIFGIASGDIVIILTGAILLFAGISLNARLFNGMTMLVLYFIDRGGYYLKRSDFDRAVQAFTRSIGRSPRRVGPYVSRAVAYMNLSNLSAARTDVDLALALDPRNFIAWTLLGELLSMEHKTDSALEAYNRAIALRENWALAYIDRGSLHQQAGRLPEALADMNRAVELSSGGVVYVLLRSILRYQMGDRDGSRQDTESALRYAPNWMLVFPEVFLENFRGHLDWALAYYARAIERFPKAYQSYQGRGDASRANGRLDWAAVDYTRAIALAPKQADLYLGRARSYAGLGFAQPARQDLQQAVRLAKHAHITRQAETLLRELAMGFADASAASPAVAARTTAE